MPSGVRFALERAIKSTTAKAATTKKGPSSLFGFGKKKKAPKLKTKVVKIYPVREILPNRASGQREVKYYRDSEGRRYEPVVWDEKTGSWQTSYNSRVHMRRDDGVIFKIRKDGSHQLVIPKQPRRKKARR
jgi:hypothetical protein